MPNTDIHVGNICATNLGMPLPSLWLRGSQHRPGLSVQARSQPTVYQDRLWQRHRFRSPASVEDCQDGGWLPAHRPPPRVLLSPGLRLPDKGLWLRAPDQHCPHPSLCLPRHDPRLLGRAHGRQARPQERRRRMRLSILEEGCGQDCLPDCCDDCLLDCPDCYSTFKPVTIVSGLLWG